MTSKQWWKFAAGITVAGIVALATLGCGETAEPDPTPVTTFQITPASGSRPTATAVPSTPAPTGSATPVGAAAQELTIVGKNIKFDKTEVSATAGTVTITFDNQDGGVPHNIHRFKGSDAQGESLILTEIRNGPAIDTVQLELSAGEYYYLCDVHPTMEGILTVS
jgi:plastocyanin